jgi:hypothetical protein
MNLLSCACLTCNTYVRGAEYCLLGIPPLVAIGAAFILMLILFRPWEFGRYCFGGIQ